MRLIVLAVMAVMDVGEAEEIFKVNNWFTYGEPLHRLREWGVRLKEMDFIDEKKLAPSEMMKVCSNLFMGSDNELPHPEVDWPAFERTLRDASAKEPELYDPVTKRMHRWIKPAELKSAYAKGGCSVM